MHLAPHFKSELSAKLPSAAQRVWLPSGEPSWLSPADAKEALPTFATEQKVQVTSLQTREKAGHTADKLQRKNITISPAISVVFTTV